MLQKFKIILLICILFFFTFSYVQAMNINMNISNTNNSLSYSNTIYTSNDDFSVSSGSIPESDFNFETILSIVSIVIGILLILLGIAIMIRLK